jgi:hypothetical protein
MYGGSAVTNYLTRTATDEEQHAARDFNHSCIIGPSGCTDLEDLAPKAFDYLLKHPDAAWNIIPPQPR